jgi:aspartyl-tRNA(Asn)/glutamyl-tRNA(Gln) amidotransferase subunit C
MKVHPETAQAVAALAKLDISPEKAAALTESMNDILNYMDTLNELGTSDVAPMYTPLDQPGPLREDAVRKGVSRAQVLENAPETDGEYFIVPRII